MDTEKDQKKIVVGKNNKKSQVIINPPEKVDPQRGYQEAFRRALQKHTIVIEKKTEVVLQAKAERSDFPANVLEQVYKRGFKNLPLNTNLTREQYAMNRVNSFIAGGAAMKEDYDLLPIVERVRATMGMKGTGGAMRPHIKREKSPYNNKTVFHVVDAQGRIKHSTSDEGEARRHLASKYQSYMEMAVSPMKRFEGTKSLVKTYKDDTPGEKNVKEEIVTEISQKLKDRYVARASDDFGHRNMARRNTTGDQQKEFARKEKNRAQGISRALRKEEKMKGEDPCWKGYHMVGKKLKAGREVPNCVPKNEEVEKLDELSKSTLGSYIKKAANSAAVTRKIASDFEHMADRAKKPSSKQASTDLADKYKAQSRARRANIGKAVDRLTKEEVEKLDELSVNKMLKYSDAAEKDRARLNAKWDAKTASEREQEKVIGREQGERRAADKIKQKTGKYPWQLKREEIEQIDELKKSTVRSYANKKQAELDDTPPMPFKKPAKSKAETEKAAKGMMGALARLSGKKPTSEGTSPAIRMQKALEKIKADRERRERLAAPHVPVKSVFAKPEKDDKK